MDFISEGEMWLPVIGFEGSYSVSSYGRVRSEVRWVKCGLGRRLVNEKLLKGEAHSEGYVQVKLGRNSRAFVHRLVLEAFVGLPSEGHEACHGNGRRNDNRLENLRWDTRKANHADKNAHGTMLRGEDHYNARLTADDVARIRADARSHRKLAAAYGVCKTSISKIKRGENWRQDPINV